MHATNVTLAGSSANNEQNEGTSTSVEDRNRPSARRRASLRAEQEAALYTPHVELVQAGNNVGESMENPNAEWASELGSRQTRMRNERLLKNLNASNVDVIVENGDDSSVASDSNGTDRTAVSPHLRQLVDAYQKSVVAVAVQDDIERALSR
jgi:hypothetical protein